MVGVPGKWWRAAAILAVLAGVLLAYWPGLGGGFVFDDYPNIVNNTAVHVAPGSTQGWVGAAMASPARNLPRPLAMLSFAVNHYFTGLDPAPMKACNIALHLFNALLVFGLVRCLLRFHLREDPAGATVASWLAIAVAALWALHPINLTAVLLIVQRMESLAHVFVFAGLWLYSSVRVRQLAGQSGGWPSLLLALFGFSAVGVLAKESAALLPLYAFLVELCLFRFVLPGARPGRLHLLFLASLWLPALLGGGWLLHSALQPGAYTGREFSLVQRLLTEPTVVLGYLQWILLPDLGQLSLYHDDFPIARSLFDPPASIVSILALALLAGLALRYRARRPLAALGVLWFLAAQALTATVIPLELVFEHRNYFASLGICLAAAELLLALWRSRWRDSVAPIAVTLALTLGILTGLRALEWRDPVTFAVAEARKNPQSPRATYYLGWVLATATNYRADSPLLETAFEALDRAAALPGSSALPEQAALILAARTGRPDEPERWRHLRQGLREHPIGPQETGALAGLVTCAVQKYCRFPPREMLQTFAAALSHGDNPEVLNNYGNYVLNVLDDPQLALRAWQEASRLNPREPQYRISLAKLHVALGHFEEARAQVAALRALGRLGQYESEAREVERRLREASR
jgi:tetratricopeptide (TPR) repeat protein